MRHTDGKPLRCWGCIRMRSAGTRERALQGLDSPPARRMTEKAGRDGENAGFAAHTETRTVAPGKEVTARAGCSTQELLARIRVNSRVRQSPFPGLLNLRVHCVSV